MDKKRAKKVDRRTTRVIVDEGKERFDNYVEREGVDRIISRLVHGRAIKPCGRECWELGFLIVQDFDHSSFVNFEELMNDKDFILQAASISPNPVMCKNYFYEYVNKHIKRSGDFRLCFLKTIYLNDNVYKLEDINEIVEMCGFQKENKILLADIEFLRLMEERLKKVDYRDRVDYHCSGVDPKELHEFKVEANEQKILCENMRNGLKSICESFTCRPKTENEEVTDFYSYMCSISNF